MSCAILQVEYANNTVKLEYIEISCFSYDILTFGRSRVCSKIIYILQIYYSINYSYSNICTAFYL